MGLQRVLQGFAGLADCDVALHPMIEEDVDHFSRRYRRKFRGLVECDLSLPIETNRVFRGPQRQELADRGRLVEPFALSEVTHALEQVVREAQTFDRVHVIPLRSLVSLQNALPR